MVELAIQGLRAQRGLPARSTLRRWVLLALESTTPAQLTVRFVGRAEARTLNRDFRGRDYATNVLTFDYQHEPVVMADLVLCAPVVEAEALAQGLDLAAHYAHLLVHGTLHAQGFDHETAKQAREMEPRESAVMLALGFADPYARG